jgi:hypothetical protein
MIKSELLDILSFNPDHACCVDVQNILAAPGYVRTTTVHEKLRVSIEFDVWGMDEGGLYYWGEFDTVELLILCIEDYLERPIEQWHALGRNDYPIRPPETGTIESHRFFKTMLASGELPMPSSGNFKTNSTYWLQFLNA